MTTDVPQPEPSPPEEALDESLGTEALALPAAPSALPSIADGIVHPLDPRSVELGRVVGGISAAVVSAALSIPTAIVSLAAPLPGWGKLALVGAWVVLSGLAAWWLLRWPAIAHRHASYRVDGLGIEMRRGVVWRRIIHVPRSRVQHTDVAQGPIERNYGLGTLSIYTAGTDHAQVELAGLAHETALAIRDHLLPGEGGDAV